MRARWESFKAIVRLWVDLFAEHNLLTYASAVAFQTFIAAVALALLGLGIIGGLGRLDLWFDTIAPVIAGRVLPAVYSGINQVANKVFATSSTGLIAFAAVLAVWEVSGVVRASMGALNRIYDSEETRPWWVRFPVSFVLAAVEIGALVGAALVVGVANVGGAWGWPLAVARWLVAISLLVIGFGVIVRFAPAERRAKKWASAGAALAVVAWIVETLVFRWYVTSVANFKTAIGSLSVFLVAASYLYVGAIILVVAMELDELVRQDLERGESRRRLLPLVAGVIRGEA